jgi:nucleoid-associated protein YgaU
MGRRDVRGRGDRPPLGIVGCVRFESRFHEAKPEMMKRSFRIGLMPIALALAGSLRADDQAAPAPRSDDVATLRADNKQLSDELAAAWKEADRLKADLASAQAASAKSADEAADLHKQLDAAKAEPAKPDMAAPAPAPAPDADAARQAADLQDKLALSLRSFSVVQDENTQLKASVDKAAAENASLSQQLDAARASNAALQVQAAATAQIEPLRTELRQSQDEASRLALENDQLRTRLAVQPPGPGASRPAPTRPGQAAVASAPPAESAAAPTPAPARTYVVVEGDTLTRISRKLYGTAGKWEAILNANRGVVKDEKSLVVGSTLKIP